MKADTDNEVFAAHDREVLDRLRSEMQRFTRNDPAVSIYLKGICHPNPGTGAYAAVLKFANHTQKVAGFEFDATNNLAELLAALEALDMLDRPHEVALFSNSQWLVRCANGNNDIGCYLDLWSMIRQHEARHVIEWRWVRVRDAPLIDEARHLAQTQLRLYAA